MTTQTIHLTNLVELHNHLSTTTPPQILWEIAHSRGIRLAEKNYWEFLKLVTITGQATEEEYHKYFDLLQLIQSSPKAVERVVHQAISLAYIKSGVETLEIRFNPMRRNKEGLYDLDKIILSAVTGLRRAQIEYPVKAGLILEADRRFTPEENKIIIEKAIKHANYGIIGIDISGPRDENFQFESLKDHFEEARKVGLGITVHAGELKGTEHEIEEVISIFKPDRIGHGIKAVNDPKLMKQLADNNIILEICPTSNIVIGSAKNWDEIGYILKTFKENGVKYTICSDNPVLLNTNVKEELKTLINNNLITYEEAVELIEVAREASFIK